MEAVCTLLAWHLAGGLPSLETHSLRSRSPAVSGVSPDQSSGSPTTVSSCPILPRQLGRFRDTKLLLVRFCTPIRYRRMCQLSTRRCRLFTNHVHKSNSLLPALNPQQHCIRPGPLRSTSNSRSRINSLAIWQSNSPTHSTLKLNSTLKPRITDTRARSITQALLFLASQRTQ